MSCSTLLKWAAAAAGVLVIGAVPAMAAHTHKHLATPAVGSAKVHKLHTPTASTKKQSVTKKHPSKLHAKKVKPTAAHHHKTTKLDKTKSTRSIM